MNMHKRYLTAFCATAAIFGSLCETEADVKMPAIFGDHMVLQQEMKLPVWGWAAAGEKVTVTVGGETEQTTAGPDGKWRVDLPPFPDGTPAVTMTVKGNNTVTFTDVLIGDVWICSGQSNMEFPLDKATGGLDEARKANDSQLRLFQVARNHAFDPQSDLVGHWALVKPATTSTFSAVGYLKSEWGVPASAPVSTFSAVGYFFGRELRADLRRPIGLISSNWGGTPAEAWTSLSGLKKEPALEHYADEHDLTVANYPKALAEAPARDAAWRAAVAKWQKAIGPSYGPILRKWNADVAAAKAENRPLPPSPPPPVPKPLAPLPPDGGQKLSCVLYNGMIAPLIPYGIKGVIWYQGESNVPQAMEYRILFSRMISDWREKWGEGNFPFLYVQLANFFGGGYTNTDWGVLRESQTQTLSLPKTGMAVAIDIGNPNDIHPKDKLNVGKRLALAAEHVAYGKDLVYSGPMFRGMQIHGGSARITFTQVGGGLKIGKAPSVPEGFQALPDTKLVGFFVAGADKKWSPADAKIDGDAVVVSSGQVTQPVAVRYAFMNSPQCNLYNKEGLPASPFRTDNWVDVKVPGMRMAPPGAAAH
jgi:sialate O-acetylesterase